MSKSRKTLLTSSLAMLIAASIALSTATYAWFASGTTAQVSDINFTATTADGLQISVDATNWKSTITNDDITGVTGNSISGPMCPLSSAGTVTSGKLALFEGTLTDGKLSVAAAKQAAAAGEGTAAVNGYYSFDLYFQNLSTENKNIVLDFDDSNKSSVIAGTTSKGLENAVRVAFIDQGDAADYTTVKSLTGGAIKIWEPNAKTHTSYAKTYRYTVTDEGTTDNTTKVAAETAYPYVGLSAVTTSGNELPVSYGAATTGTVLKGTDENLYQQDSDLTIATIPAGQICKVTIVIWIEGQDVDCNNAEAGADIVTALKFKSDTAASQ